jgi:hypothetical protein
VPRLFARAPIVHELAERIIDRRVRALVRGAVRGR